MKIHLKGVRLLFLDITCTFMVYLLLWAFLWICMMLLDNGLDNYGLCFMHIVLMLLYSSMHYYGYGRMVKGMHDVFVVIHG